MIGATLQEVARNYRSAASEPLAGHPLAQFIRGEAADRLRETAGPAGARLEFQGSPGQGNWAELPWLAVFDPVVRRVLGRVVLERRRTAVH